MTSPRPQGTESNGDVCIDLHLIEGCSQPCNKRAQRINTLTLLLDRTALEESNQEPEMKQPTLVTLPGHRVGEKGDVESEHGEICRRLLAER